MNVVIGSAFRNMGGRVDRYFRQACALKEHIGPDHAVRVIAVEGDSLDATAAELARAAERWQIPVDIREYCHGQPQFASTEEPARLKMLSGVCNEVFAGVREDDDVLLYVESDLIWQPHDVGSCIDAARERRGGFDVVAPMIWAGQEFYDIWAFRGLDGERFGPFAPYHSSLNGHGLAEVGSVGSCLAMRAEVAAKVRVGDDNALVGWCAEARKQGYRLAVATDFGVNHP